MNNCALCLVQDSQGDDGARPLPGGTHQHNDSVVRFCSIIMSYFMSH